MSRGERAALAAIVAAAAVLRLAWPGLTEFKQDEAHLYALALDLAELKAFPLRGISSSVGFPNAPMSVYVYALPLAVWKSPLAATLFTGLLNALSVGLTYAWVRRYWGRRAALAAALLFAAAPWAVIYSRKIWAQNLLPLFVTGYAATALLGLVEGRGRWLAAHIVLLFVSIQIHLSGLALAPVTALLMLIFRGRVAWRYVVYGVGVAAASLLPFALYALGRSGEWAGAAGTVREWLARPTQVTTEAFSLAAMVMLGTEVRGLAGPNAFRAFEAAIPDFRPFLWLGGALVLLGVLIAAARLFQLRQAQGASFFAMPAAERRASEAGLVVLLWLIVPTLFFVRHSTPVFPHYFIILLPAPFVLAGVAADWLSRRWTRAWLMPLAVATAQGWLALAAIRFAGTQATPGAFGVPLGRWLDTVEAARAAGSPEVIVISAGADPAVDEAPAVFEALLRDTPHRIVDGRNGAVFPADAAVVVVWPAPGGFGWPLEAAYQSWGGGQWAAQIPLRAGEGEALVAVGGVRPSVPEPRAASALLANGVELLGSGESAAVWQLWWLAPGPALGEAVHVFAHLYSDGDSRIAQVDVPALHPAQWQPGDLVVSVFALPPGGAFVRAGMYGYPSLEAVAVLDAAGNPAGEWIDFPR